MYIQNCKDQKPLAPVFLQTLSVQMVSLDERFDLTQDVGGKGNPHQGQEQWDLLLSAKHFAEVEGVEEVAEH